MKKNLAVTIDLEDYRKNRYSKDKPYQKQTEIILNWLLKEKIKATFFMNNHQNFQLEISSCKKFSMQV